MKASGGYVFEPIIVKGWQMGNICVSNKTLPCFRVDPHPCNYGTGFDLEKKAYCIPWEEKERTVLKTREPCCFCWCCFCTCALKQSRTTTLRSRRGDTLLDITKHGGNDQGLNSEKVKQWMFDFESLLKDEVGKGLFENFLRQEYSEENLKFWSEVERMKTVQDETARYISIRRIYREYIQPRSSNEVNIEAWIRKSIEENLEKSSADIFNPAQAQVYLLMYRQSWPRFLASRCYQSLLLKSNV